MAIRSGARFTTGLLNIPKNDNTRRYPFFEIDSDDMTAKARVMASYFTRGYDLAIHNTGNGWHFLSTTSLTKEQHSDWIMTIKDLNPKWPPQCLRIEPNKYVNEHWAWTICNNSTELNDLCHAIAEGRLDYVHRHYRTVRYPLP